MLFDSHNGNLSSSDPCARPIWWLPVGPRGCLSVDWTSPGTCLNKREVNSHSTLVDGPQHCFKSVTLKMGHQNWHTHGQLTQQRLSPCQFKQRSHWHNTKRKLMHLQSYTWVDQSSQQNESQFFFLHAPDHLCNKWTRSVHNWSTPYWKIQLLFRLFQHHYCLQCWSALSIIQCLKTPLTQSHSLEQNKSQCYRFLS